MEVSVFQFFLLIFPENIVISGDSNKTRYADVIPLSSRLLMWSH